MDVPGLTAIFLANRGTEARPELEETLRRLCAAAREAWPGVGLSDETFVGALARHAGQAADPVAALESLHASDLYLACAAAESSPAALEAFERAFFPQVERAVASFDGGAPLAAEVRQVLRERFFLGLAGRPPAIATYSGSGPLAAWVRAGAVRAAARLREERGPPAEGNEGELEWLADAGSDPELRLLKATYRRELREAVHEALDRLAPRERNLLRLHAVDKLTGGQIGAAYGVSGPTVSRWLQQAREALSSETRRLLRQRLSLSAAQIESLYGLVHSQLELSLARVLR